MNEFQAQEAPNYAFSESQDDIFASLSHYPFDSDPEYLSGLSAIFGHPSIPPSALELSQNADLVLQAKCFYFVRKHGLPPIDPSNYRTWLQSRPPGSSTSLPASDPTHHLSTTASQDESSAAANVSTSLEGTAVGTEEPPPYPTSFAAIVDLITRNVPVPGIEEVPTTVLDHGSSKVDQTPRRKKPWEAQPEPAGPLSTELARPVEEHNNGVTQGEDTVNGHLTTGEGLVKILQPNAIPESGLLSKDE